MSKLSQFLGGSGGDLEVVYVDSAVTVDTGTAVGVDTSNGSVTVTMPANPSIGDRVSFFDIGFSWGANPVTIKLNGDTVQYYSGENDRFMISGDYCILQLLYIGAKGWIDFSYFEKGAFPTWYNPTDVISSSIADLTTFLETRELVEVVSTDESGEYEVQENGFYVLAICGSGAYRNQFESSGRAGHPSTLKLNGTNLFTAEGADRQGTSWNKKVATVHTPQFLGTITNGPQLVGVDVEVGSLAAEEVFNIRPLYSAGYRSAEDTNSQGVLGSSVILYLQEGDVVAYAVAARASSSGLLGSPGRARIHQIRYKE